MSKGLKEAGRSGREAFEYPGHERPSGRNSGCKDPGVRGLLELLGIKKGTRVAGAECRRGETSKRCRDRSSR